MNVAQYRNAVRDLILDHDFDYWVTLTWNEPRRKEVAEKNIGYLLAKIDDCLLGYRWHKKPSSRRTHAIFFFENIESNIHVHGYIDIRGQPDQKFRSNLLGLWKSIVPAGSVDCVPMAIAPESFAYYGTKKINPSIGFDNAVFSSDFH